MATQDGQPESSTAPQRESFASLSPAPSSGSRRPTRGNRGRGKGKALEPRRQTSGSRVSNETLLTMIQSLADQVSALRTGQVPSERVSPERRPSATGYESVTPPTRSTTVMPTLEPLLDPLRFPSMDRSRVTDAVYRSRTYKTRDVQTLSDRTDPTYEAWSIQLEGKFLEPQFLDCTERVRMHYVFSVTSGVAQNHLQSRMLQTANNPFRSVNEMIKVLETASINPNRAREASIEYRQLTISPLETFVDFKTWYLLLAEEAGIL